MYIDDNKEWQQTRVLCGETGILGACYPYESFALWDNGSEYWKQCSVAGQATDKQPGWFHEVI